MNIQLMKGDCLKQLKKLKDNSVDSVVTDPPYGLGFMGKDWDTFDKSQFGKKGEEGENDLKNKKNFKILPRYNTDGLYGFTKDWAKECYRVLKPGGHLLSFAGSRTYHKICMGVEDAGFEIRDQIMWVYGSGFPKSHNIGKAVDKLLGNEREVVGSKIHSQKGVKVAEERTTIGAGAFGEPREAEITKGNTKWEGWGTALKPAHEPIVMARKPFKGSVAQNVLEYGTGGINIDECRIGNELMNDTSIRKGFSGNDNIYGGGKGFGGKPSGAVEGRFPANIIFDEEAGKTLDEQSGISTSGKNKIEKGTGGIWNKGTNLPIGPEYGDTGGASRFFYCPKAQKKDRDEGVEYKGQVVKGRDENQDKLSNPFKLRPSIGATYAGNQTTSKIGANPNKPTQPRANIHPTVKPTDLMSYLVRLVTPKGGVVLDPFMGSGSTGKASVREGMDFIGIEREDEYMEIAKSRIEHEKGKHNYRKFFDI